MVDSNKVIALAQIVKTTGFKIILIGGFTLVYKKLINTPEGILVEGTEISGALEGLGGASQIIPNQETLLSRMLTQIEKSPDVKIRFNSGREYLEFLP